MYKRGIIRLNADGSFDSTFNNSGSGANGPIYSMALQKDGKIIIVGYFNLFNGIATKCIMRLNSDGSVDPTFNYSKGVNNIVHAVYIQLDGKILIGGTFSLYENTSRKYMARLNSDGNLDQSFDAGNTFMSTPICFGVQSDGKIITGGSQLKRLERDGSRDFSFSLSTFGTINQIHVFPDNGLLVGGAFETNSEGYNLCKLRENGTVDNSFSSGLPYQNGSSLAGVSDFIVQQDSKIVITGFFSTYNGIPNSNIVRVNANGSLDNTFSQIENLSGLPFIDNVSLQHDGKYIIGGRFTKFGAKSRNRLARLESDGKLDKDFSRATGANNSVLTFAKQDINQKIIGGNFTDYNDVLVNRLARINNNGELDNSFQIGSGFNNIVNTIVVQNDKKIIVGGAFSNFNNIPSNSIARLSQNGSYDETFNIGMGANAPITSLILQNDQKVLIAGSFTKFNDYPANRIVRLSVDGTVDTLFNIGTGANGVINKVKIQVNGKILLAGDFTIFNGKNANRIVRLNADGSVDTSFNSDIGADEYISAIELQSDDKILIGGAFRNFNGIMAGSIARLNSSGSFDSSFTVGSGFDGNVNAIFFQDDSKIIVGGTFSNFRNSVAAKICRLNGDGTLDTGFVYGNGTNGSVNVIASGDNGSVLIGGQFTKYNDVVRKRIAKIFSQINLSVNNYTTLDNKVSIYPNPFVEKISIKSKELITEISLISMEGKTVKVLKVSANTVNMNTKDLISGIYFLKIQTKNDIKSYKILRR